MWIAKEEVAAATRAKCSMIGRTTRMIGAGGGGASPSGIDPNDPNMKRMAALMESCYAKTVMSGVMGFGLGGVFGMFMASVCSIPPPTTLPLPTSES